METLAKYLRQAAVDTEKALDSLMPMRQTAPEAALYYAMRYSLFAGGKRLRPALFFAGLDLFGLPREKYLAFAAALEMIHTYSLVHDDLPAMDNDDLRRGQPTCHKVYGEGMAILAGDGLLTHAFALMLRPIPGLEPANQLAAAGEVARQAGLGGMVAGQAAEMESQSRGIDRPLLDYIYQGKTCALFAASLLAAAHLAGAKMEEQEALRRYAEHAGLCFQITDDILDVEGDQAQLGKPVGSDQKNQKLTYASLFSLQQAKQHAADYAAAASDDLAIFQEKADLLRAFAKMFAERQK